MNILASILILPLVAAQGTNKTLAPTPGLLRPTSFPTDITPQPTYDLITNSPNAMSFSYGYEQIIEAYGSGKSNKTPDHGYDEYGHGSSGKSGKSRGGKSRKSGKTSGKSGKSSDGKSAKRSSRRGSKSTDAGHYDHYDGDHYDKDYYRGLRTRTA